MFESKKKNQSQCVVQDELGFSALRASTLAAAAQWTWLLVN